MKSARRWVVLAVSVATCAPPSRRSGPVDAAVDVLLPACPPAAIVDAAPDVGPSSPADAAVAITTQDGGVDASALDAPATIGDAPGGGTPDPAVDSAPVDPLMATARCTSGLVRSPNESEGPEMSPGYVCIGCHQQDNNAGGDAPLFGFAGTVFPTGHEPDSCSGSAAEGAQIVVTDATGAVHIAPVNRAGNFQWDQAIALPFQAKVVFQGRERVMVEKQAIGDCNLCHTQTGAGNAKGRIVLP